MSYVFYIFQIYFTDVDFFKFLIIEPSNLQIITTSEYPDMKYNGGMQIKLRGNSTAYQAKRPFRIKLDDKTPLFGMEESKHWCLLANVYDRTNLRNKLSYDFGMALGLATCESNFVNVIFNGEYYGMYQLTEAIRAEEGRVDIFNWEEEAEDVAKAIAKKEGLSKDDRDKLEENLTKNLSWITSGKFGNYTAEAVKVLQGRYGMEKTGVADDAFLNRLYN